MHQNQIDGQVGSSGGKELPTGTRLEEFVVERVLGSGGFGITYLARDTNLNRLVVIKENLPNQFAHRDTTSLTIHPGLGREDQENFQWSLENFSKEAAMLASLDHPGIVKVLRSFQAFGTAYFVMPFVEGVALDELILKRRGEGLAFAEEELRGWLERSLDALAHLHDRGIYHRDIKPGNLLITNEGVPVLIDFGSARQRLSERSMTVVESAGYTPFEQLQSRGNVGPWSDLYALGATLVKVITGETPPKTNDRSFGDPWIPLLGRADTAGRFSDGFLSGIDRSLKLPIEDRWQSAGDWKEALGSGVMPQTPQVRTTPQAVVAKDSNPAIPVRKDKRWAWMAAALVILAGGGWWATGLGGGSSGVVGKIAAGVLPGGLVITSEPSGALVKNSAGEELGVTPAELKGLEAGEGWQAVLELAGYLPAEVRAEVVAGETKLVPPVKLVPQPQKVIVTSEPSGAEVLEDGKVLGSTPWEGEPREVGGAVKLTLRKPGYEEAGVSGEVELGVTLVLQGALKASPQKVIVTSEPSDAVVLEEGKVLGKTPLELAGQVPGTAVAYTLRMEGYEEATLEGTVKVGGPLALSASLKPLPKPKMEGSKAGEERDFEIAPGVSMTFCWIPPGEFMMGSPVGELGRENDETQHRVRITKGYWMGKYEVTQAQWRACGGVDPSARQPATKDGEVIVSWEQLASSGIRAANFKGAELPVERVSWDEVTGWCQGINAGERAKSGPEAGWSYGLPTEAQWEYAARGGTTTALNNGKNLTSEHGKCVNLNEVGWYTENSGYKTHPVGQKRANAWGLHDMHGNVFEWCADWYGKYSVGDLTDPVGATSGTGRVYRGGYWRFFADYCRVAGRYGSTPTYADSYSIGFRVARSSGP